LLRIVNLLQRAEKHRFVLIFFETFLDQAKKVETLMQKRLLILL